MKENDIVEECVNSWASPFILVPKPDGFYCFCTDFRKVNAAQKEYPLPRLEDCIDEVGDWAYIRTFDMLKGYWQVPL